MEEISRALIGLKEIIEELEHNSIQKYVFVPLLNNVNYDYKEPILTLTSKNNTIIKIKILGNNHITKIRENDGKIDINNILVLTGFAINENSLGLIRTLDPCDHVKGILVNGKIQQIEQNLSKMEIIYPDVKVMMNKLYFLRRSDVDLQNNIKITLLIDSIAESNSIKQTKYCSLDMKNNQIELRGIADLYGINNDAINNLAKKLSDIINYHYIILR